MHVFESIRRLKPEEGFSDKWPAFILRKKKGVFISLSPMLHEKVSHPLHSSSFINMPVDSLTREFTSILVDEDTINQVGCSFIYLPDEISGKINIPKGFKLKGIKIGENTSGSTYVPNESINEGTAFGIYEDDKLVSWAEATPLPTRTDETGIMLIGIETESRYRGKGFAKACLKVVTKKVLEINKIPLYFCSIKNIASQKTVLSCGYKIYGEMYRARKKK